MATSVARAGLPSSTSTRRTDDRPQKRKEKRTDIWTSLLRQTRQAQARNRNNALAHRQLVVCGGSSDDQRQFVSTLARPPPPTPPSRNRDQRDQRPRGQLNLSNRYAYGYGHVTLYSPSQAGVGPGSYGQEAEEAARLEVHTVGEAEAAYDPVLRRLLAPKAEEADGEGREENDDMLEHAEKEGRRPAVAVLLSWKEPWLFLERLRAWLQLLARAVEPNARPEEDITEILKESKLKINFVVQHVEAQQELEREGWQEETFDYVSQMLRTAILPLHPFSSLIFTSSAAPPQQPGLALSESQKTVYQSLELDLATLSPKASAGGAPAKPEELQPKHNVVDRMNIVVPHGWDSAGKIRLLSENFSPEEVLAAWQQDLMKPVFQAFTAPPKVEESVEPATEPSTNGGASRPEEEVYEAASSPIEATPDDSPPVSPSKLAPSAIRTYESQIQDPAAHKRPKPPAITVTTRPEQDFLKEMKAELDALAAKDRERGDNSTSASSRSASGTSAAASRIGIPSGESSGALNNLGDVSFNVGGVSYNTVSAEAAIERIKRPAEGTTSSPAGGRNITPRQPRREDRDREREQTPSSNRSDFPSEDLEKYFASLAKKAAGGESRSGTPSRHG